MKHFQSLKVDQKLDDLLPQLCIHSVAANHFRGGDWEDFWPCGLQPTDETYDIDCNSSTEFVTLRNTQQFFLAAVRMRGEKNISILFNNTSRQIRPECSSHKHRGCKHFHFYKQKIEEQVRAENPGLLEYNYDAYGHFWDRKARDQVTVPKPAQLYDDDTHHFRQHGFNKTRFDFPLRRDPALQKKIAEINKNFESANPAITNKNVLPC